MCRGSCHGFRRGGAAHRLQHSLTQWSLILSPCVPVEMEGPLDCCYLSSRLFWTRRRAPFIVCVCDDAIGAF